VLAHSSVSEALKGRTSPTRIIPEFHVESAACDFRFIDY
jgi:hypothetical protein